MAEKIRKMSEHYLTISILSIFKGQTATIESMEWPLLGIIKTVFEGYTIDKFKALGESTLIDYFCIDNELQYNTRHYEQFPPTVKFDYIVDNKIPIYQAGLANYHSLYESGELQKEEEKAAAIQDNEKKNKAQRRGMKELTSAPITKKEKEEIQKKIQETLSSDFYYDT